MMEVHDSVDLTVMERKTEHIFLGNTLNKCCRTMGLAMIYSELTKDEASDENNIYSWNVQHDFEEYETLKDWVKHSLRNSKELPDYMSFDDFWTVFQAYIGEIYGEKFDEAHNGGDK